MRASNLGAGGLRAAGRRLAPQRHRGRGQRTSGGLNGPSPADSRRRIARAYLQRRQTHSSAETRPLPWQPDCEPTALLTAIQRCPGRLRRWYPRLRCQFAFVPRRSQTSCRSAARPGTAHAQFLRFRTSASAYQRCHKSCRNQGTGNPLMFSTIPSTGMLTFPNMAIALIASK